MPSFQTGLVVRILEERPGLARVEVDMGKGPERAYALTQLTGPVALGDQVVVNTTAVELGLGTGGWHVIHWNLEHPAWSEPGPGHILKARYTSLQADVGSAEEHAELLKEVESVHGMPVVAAALHSQVPAIAAAFKSVAPGVRLGYIMTDGAAMPLVLSDLVAELRDRELLDTVITSGHAFGGDYEAVSIFSALAVARHLANLDAVVVAMGPGIVGTGTRLGFSGMEAGQVLDATVGVGGMPIACLRASFADPRARHQGISHHSRTALRIGCRSRVLLPFPTIGGAEEAILRRDLLTSGLSDLHEVIDIDPGDVVALLDDHGLDVLSMGRTVDQDPVLFQCAAAAGLLAARYSNERRDNGSAAPIASLQWRTGSNV